MSIGLHETRVHCPWCGEGLHLLIDPSAGGQSYVEDCEVCCRPMTVTFETDGDDVASVEVGCEG